MNGGIRKWEGGDENIRAFEEWLQRRGRDTYDRYLSKKEVVKRQF